MLDIEWSQNNTILLPNAVEITSTPTSNIALDNYNGMQFDASRIGLEYDLSGNGGADVANEFDLTASVDHQSGKRRRRRSTSRLGRMYNPYAQQLYANEFTYPDMALQSHSRKRRGLFDSHEHILNNLPLNRTIYFDCVNAEEGACVQAKFTVYNFEPGNVPILISFNFSIDLNVIGKWIWIFILLDLQLD